MRYDILFHLTTAPEFKEAKANGYYEPSIFEEEGYIQCAGGDQVEELANALYAGKKRILLLVIDVSTLEPEVKYEKKGNDKKHPYIYEPINLDAVIDKISIQSEKDGNFEISFKSYS